MSDHEKAHEEATRSVTALFLALVLAGGVCLLPMIPSVRAVLRVAPLDVAISMGIFAILVTTGTIITPRYSRTTRIGDIFDSIETVTIEGAVLWLVYASGRADSFFWVLWMAHAMLVGNAGVKVRTNLISFAVPPAVLGIAFVIGRHDAGAAALCAVTGAIGTYICWFAAAVSQKLAAVDTERAALAAQLADSKVREDRQRIARDIHDGLGSDLAAIDWRLRGLRGEAIVTAEVDELVARLGNGASELRDIVWALRAPTRTWSEIVEYLHSRATDLCGDRITLELSAEGDGTVARRGELAVDFLRAVMELVHNAVRHADARRIVVAISSTEDALKATVEDDGKGMPTDVAARDEGGLANLRVRVARGKGELAITPRAPTGTSFQLSFPV